MYCFTLPSDRCSFSAISRLLRRRAARDAISCSRGVRPGGAGQLLRLRVLCRCAQSRDPVDEVRVYCLRQQWLEIAVVFHKGHHKAVFGSVCKGLSQQRPCLLVLAQHLIGRRRLEADVQRYQGVVLSPAGGQRPSLRPMTWA